MSRPFTLDRLADLYEARTEWPDRVTFWRHDVDYSVEAAWAMAKFESSIGVSGTYFIMDKNPFYSAREAMLLSVMLSNAGHRVGLHVDTRRVPVADLREVVRDDVPVSFHCPRSYELWTDHGFEHAYAPEWEGRYFSDSRGEFSHGDPEDSCCGKLQINLHPEWWFDPGWHERVDDVAYEDFWYEPKSRLTR